MNEDQQRAAFLSALTTEHFVLQTATSTTYTEASARSSLYVMALSSSLVAIGFLVNSSDLLLPFLTAVLPAVFLLGLFTVARLVETGLESMQYLVGISRIRARYRTLGPDANELFAKRNGRWPEVVSPAQRLGSVLAFFGTTASMIAVINNVVGGVAVALLVHVFIPAASRMTYTVIAIVVALALTWLFYRYQRWRFAAFDAINPATNEQPFA